MVQPSSYNTQVAEVTRFIVDATKAVMAITTSVPDADGTEVVPLHFVREAVIQHQNFILELHKEQGSLWLKKLTVSWVPEKDANPPEDVFRTVFCNNVEKVILKELGDRGFYQVFCETSEDFKYFVRLHVFRL